MQGIIEVWLEGLIIWQTKTWYCASSQSYVRDWAGSIDDQKSSSGYLFCFGTKPIFWSSKKQKIVAFSSAEVLLICSYRCTIRSSFVKKNTLWYATKWKSSNHHTLWQYVNHHTLGQYVNHSHDKKFNVSQSNTTHWTSSSLHQKIGARRWNTIGISQYKWAATRSFHKSHHIRKFVEFKKNMRITN